MASKVAPRLGRTSYLSSRSESIPPTSRKTHFTDMAKLDWEKAKRREKNRNRPKGKTRKAKQLEHDRQQALAMFVFQHDIGCFNCKAIEARWAKTGFSKRGPWAICKECIQKR
jgi:hypothetical protein